MFYFNRITEYEGISASQEIIIGGKLTDDSYTTHYQTRMTTDVGEVHFESDVQVSADAKPEFKILKSKTISYCRYALILIFQKSKIGQNKGILSK